MLYYVQVILNAPCPACGAPMWFDWDDGEPQTYEYPGTPGDWVPAGGAPQCGHAPDLDDAQWKTVDAALCEAVELVSEEEGRLSREAENAMAAMYAEDARDAGPVLTASRRSDDAGLDDLPF